MNNLGKIDDGHKNSVVEDYASRVPSLNLEQSWVRARGQRGVTTALLPLELLRASRLLRKKQLLNLHLGCGETYLTGWTNIDLFRPGKRRDLYWDLRRRLPFPDNVVEAIFSEHLFEHLDIVSGLKLLKECRRVLSYGGVMRIGVPDLERYVRSYLGADKLIDDYRPGRPTRGIAFGEVFFFHGHRSMYDFDTLKLLLREVGFTAVERSTSGKGRLCPCPDSEFRMAETLYVEAVK